MASPTSRSIQVVTDSLAWIPEDLVKANGLRVVPLHVSFGEEQFTETVDLSTEIFFQRLRQARDAPKTSQPSVGEFLAVYREVAETTGAILSIHASSGLSGTYRSAETAAEMLRQERPDVRIETVDTQTAASAQGIVAIRAAQQARAGASFEEVVASARALAPKTRLLFVVETLEYLQKGGRIGRARALIGSLLHIRPILTVAEGEVAPLDRARTRAKALEKVLEHMAAYARGRPFGHVGVLNAAAPEVARELKALIVERFAVPPERFIECEIGPVIAAYVGPGAFGASFHCD
ncbi:MAG TPA: DegV family protein [Chloroflexota bacterium]|nr:DegV family protein [Chloroflexota bacterium]